MTFSLVINLSEVMVGPGRGINTSVVALDNLLHDVTWMEHIGQVKWHYIELIGIDHLLLGFRFHMNFLVTQREV